MSTKTGVYRGDIWSVDIKKSDSEVFHGVHPAVCISYWKSNTKSDLIQIVPITSKKKKTLKTNVLIEGFGLNQDSTIICNQILTVNKSSLIKKIGQLDYNKMLKVEQALKVQLQLDSYNNLKIDEIENMFAEKVNLMVYKERLSKCKNRIWEHYSNHEHIKAINECDKLLDLITTNTEDKDEFSWYAYYCKSINYLKLNQYIEALENAKESLKYIGKLEKINDRYSCSMWAVANCYEAFGYIDKAKEIFKSLSKYYRSVGDTMMCTISLFNLAKASNNINRMLNVIKIFKNIDTAINKWNDDYSKESALNQMYRDLMLTYIKNEDRLNAAKFLSKITDEKMKKQYKDKISV